MARVLLAGVLMQLSSVSRTRSFCLWHRLCFHLFKIRCDV